MRFIFTFCICLMILSTQAQQSMNPGGSDASGIGGSVAYSIGQVVYTMDESLVGSILQGVQQPFEISVETGFYDITEQDLKITTYPNPSKDNLILKVESNNFEELQYVLTDSRGACLKNEQIIGEETKIELTSLPPSTYLLKIYKNKKEQKFFKIIKIQN
jgi:hypothetical protein